MTNEYKISDKLSKEEIQLIKDLEGQLNNKVILIAYDKNDDNT